MSEIAGGAMWDERYGGADFAYGLAPNAFLAAQKRLMKPGMRALVPGDGEGSQRRLARRAGLAGRYARSLRQGRREGRRLAEARGVSINARQIDALAWEWPRAHYDLIALIYLHLVAPDRRRLHASALAALKPGGCIVLEAFRPEQIVRQKTGARGGPRDVALLYSLDDLREDFAGAEILELAEADVDLSEGALHVGPSAVVRAIVRDVAGLAEPGLSEISAPAYPGSPSPVWARFRALCTRAR